MDETDVDGLIDGLIDREGGYVDNPADKGGPTCFGITQAVARAHGYAGPMQQLPRSEAVAIYRRLYWLRPRLDEVARRSGRIAAELFDTGANMGPAVAVTFLQRALTALNRNAKDYPDLTPDGRVGPTTLAALDTFLSIRGASSGETVLLRALEALQGERYLRLAERRPGNYILDKITALSDKRLKRNGHELRSHQPGFQRRGQGSRISRKPALAGRPGLPALRKSARNQSRR
jgi:lysozyme family protein